MLQQQLEQQLGFEIRIYYYYYFILLLFFFWQKNVLDGEEEEYYIRVARVRVYEREEEEIGEEDGNVLKPYYGGENRRLEP